MPQIPSCASAASLALGAPGGSWDGDLTPQQTVSGMSMGTSLTTGTINPCPSTSVPAATAVLGRSLAVPNPQHPNPTLGWAPQDP